MKIHEVILIIIVLAIISICILALASIGLDEHEKYECQKWQAEATTYQGYFLTGWQQAQCNRWGITIEAPVQ